MQAVVICILRFVHLLDLRMQCICLRGRSHVVPKTWLLKPLLLLCYKIYLRRKVKKMLQCLGALHSSKTQKPGDTGALSGQHEVLKFISEWTRT